MPCRSTASSLARFLMSKSSTRLHVFYRLCLGKNLGRHGPKSSVLAKDVGIRGKFRINDHPHRFVLAVSPRENNMGRWCEGFEFDAPAAFWTGGSKRKRKPIA